MTGFYTAVVAIAAITYSATEQRAARKDQKRARAIQQKSDKLKTQRGAVEQIRNAQIAAASIAQSAENTGVATTTLAAGAQGSVQTQAGSNLGFAQQIFNHQQAKNRLLESAFSHLGTAANAQAVASVATTALGAKGST